MRTREAGARRVSGEAPGLFPWLETRAWRRQDVAWAPGLRQGEEEPDDADLMPELVPLIDPGEPPDDEGSGDDAAMTIPALDLTAEDETAASEEGTGLAEGPELTSPVAPAPEKAPLVKQWWFWAAVGAAVLAGGGAVAAASGPEVVPPSGSLGTMDRR